MKRTAAIVAGTFALMEPATYLTHRYVMHGFGMVWHRSHHRRWAKPRAEGESFFEANDGFPVVFAGISMMAIAAGFNHARLRALVPITAGVTLYGATYAFVHDGYIHQRVPVRAQSALLARLAEAHTLHHRFGGEPYGMLAPVVPASLRARAERGERVTSVPRP